MCLINELARFNKTTHQYRLTDESGPAHKKSFTVCLKIGGSGNQASDENDSDNKNASTATAADAAADAAVAAGEEYIATGPSIKKAQHAAAAIALEKTALRHPPPKSRQIKNSKEDHRNVMRTLERFVKNAKKPPVELPCHFVTRTSLMPGIIQLPLFLLHSQHHPHGGAERARDEAGRARPLRLRGRSGCRRRRPARGRPRPALRVRCRRTAPASAISLLVFRAAVLVRPPLPRPPDGGREDLLRQGTHGAGGKARRSNKRTQSA